MSDTGIDIQSQPVRTSYGGDVQDYFALLKPRVMSLVVFTALVGILSAPGDIHPVLAITALISIAVGAGAAGALNMWYDADIDCYMQRTAKRPIPRGKIHPDDALSFGIVLSLFSIVTLGLLVNIVAGVLLALTIGFYLFIYTMWLKRRTPHNIVIGGAAGAFPPMIGWAAVTGSVSVESIILFLMIFMWTPPHFWALSLYRAKDYERVQVPMLPVVAGFSETCKQILIYSVCLLPITMLPAFVGLGGALYFSVAILLNAHFLYLSFQIFAHRANEETAIWFARRLFSFSIFYLFILFAVLLIEHGFDLKISFEFVSANVLGLGLFA
ncbi:MAG: heme o synthase [Pseudomonadota bacterium]